MDVRKTGKLEETRLKKQVEMKECQENEDKFNLDIQEEEIRIVFNEEWKKHYNFRIVEI